jgi:prolyl-tRNA synthetase
MWRGIEVGHVFKLGTKYSEALRATYLDAEGKEQVIFMGCYGIGVSRTVAACIEQNHDADGIIFPIPIAAGVEVLFDDRDERPGSKFKDADLIGIPLRLVVGSKNLAEGKVELKVRKGGEVSLLPLAEAVETVKALVAEALNQ